jgi:hypothetical protein
VLSPPAWRPSWRHRGIDFDVDPLAVLMTRVWTTPLETAALRD